MARKVDVEAGETDLTPMIDVCFLLIAFFIMVTEVSKAEIVEIFLPHASYATEDTDPPENRLIVNLEDQIRPMVVETSRKNLKLWRRVLDTRVQQVPQISLSSFVLMPT
jgi:biopolymer transport protein ExbD